jgi:hypothetical protein
LDGGGNDKGRRCCLERVASPDVNEETDGKGEADETEFQEGFNVLILDDFGEAETEADAHALVLNKVRVVGTGGAHGGTGGTEASAEDHGHGSFLPGFKGGAGEIKADVGAFGDVTVKDSGLVGRFVGQLP